MGRNEAKIMKQRFLWAAALALALTQVLARTAESPAGAARYQLLEGSNLQDDCPICGRPTIIMPMRGSFELVPDETDPVFISYTVTNAQFYAGERSSPS